MIYLVVLILLIAGCFLYDYRQFSRGKLAYWIFLMVILICIAGFRYKMGTDSIKYENYYHWSHTLSQLRPDDFKDTRFAPLYIIVSTICRSITYDFMLLQFVVAITLNSSVFYFFWKNTKHPFFALLLYCICMYINLNMEVLRESMAVSVFLWSWPYFKRGEWIKYYLLSIVAFLFHLSALIMFVLPILWLPWFRWLFTFGPRLWVVCSGVLILSFIVQIFFSDLVLMLAVTENMAERAVVYSKTDLFSNTLNVFGVISELLKYVIYPLVALYFIHKSIESKYIAGNDFKKQEFFTLLSVYVTLFSIGIAIFLRYKNYFFLFAILTMSDWIFSSIRFNGRYYRLKLIHWIMIFIPFFAINLSTFWNDYNKSGSIKVYQMYYPYSNRFDEHIDPQRQKAIDYSRRL